METLYFNQPYLQLYFDQEKKMARAVWSGFLSSAEIQTGCHMCLRLLDELNPTAWLADNRKMKAIRQQDQEWILAEFGPRVGNSTIRKMATVISEDIFNQMAIENLFAKAGDQVKFNHRYFKNEEEARAWIEQDIAFKENMKMA